MALCQNTESEDSHVSESSFTAPTCCAQRQVTRPGDLIGFLVRLTLRRIVDLKFRECSFQAFRCICPLKSALWLAPRAESRPPLKLLAYSSGKEHVWQQVPHENEGDAKGCCVEHLLRRPLVVVFPGCGATPPPQCAHLLAVDASLSPKQESRSNHLPQWSWLDYSTAVLRVVVKLSSKSLRLPTRC